MKHSNIFAFSLEAPRLEMTLIECFRAQMKGFCVSAFDL